MHCPVHRPVASTVLSGVVDAIVITAVLWRASRAKKLALGKDGLTNLIVGLVWRRAQPSGSRERTFPSARQPQRFSVKRVQTRIVSDQVVSVSIVVGS